MPKGVSMEETGPTPHCLWWVESWPHLSPGQCEVSPWWYWSEGMRVLELAPPLMGAVLETLPWGCETEGASPVPCQLPQAREHPTPHLGKAGKLALILWVQESGKAEQLWATQAQIQVLSRPTAISASSINC